MKKYRITYKEARKPKPGSTYYTGDKTEAQVIEFFGLDEPEVEWYKVELIN